MSTWLYQPLLPTSADLQASGGGGGQVVLNTLGSTEGTSGNISNCTISGTDKVLYVLVMMRGSDITGVTWDAAGANQALTQVDAYNFEAIMHVYVYRLINPTDGSNKTITISKSGTDRFGAVAILATGTDQTTPNGSFSHDGANPGTTITNNVSSGTGEIVVDALAYWDDGDVATLTPGANQTPIINDSFTTGGEGLSYAASQEPGVSTTTMS
jgi:hypothetical protein